MPLLQCTVGDARLGGAGPAAGSWQLAGSAAFAVYAAGRPLSRRPSFQPGATRAVCAMTPLMQSWLRAACQTPLFDTPVPHCS